MERLSIGEFARMSRLSPKALRMYDELGLLAPARVDAQTGYRWYDPAQLDRARLVASLRQVGMPLAEIKAVLDLAPGDAAERLAGYWATVETDHVARGQLARYLVDRLSGKRSVMYEVSTRQLPARQLLCLKRHVENQDAVFALGKEAIGLFKSRPEALASAPAPHVDGIVGASFLVYYGEVNDDSDGPVEWCRPVPADTAEGLAAHFPELTLREEPAHEEAYVDVGRAGQLGA